VSAGADAEAARHQATPELGGVEQIKKEVCDSRIGVRVEGIWTNCDSRCVDYGAVLA
jgi:hypothetical protein